jgi:hypothetical protein
MIRRGNAPCPYFIFWWRRVCCWEEDREETGGRANNVFCLIRFRGRRRDRLAPATASPGSAALLGRPLLAHPVEVPPPSKPQRVCCLPLRSTQSPSSPRKPTHTMVCLARARAEQRGSRRSATGGRGALDTCRHSLRILHLP